MLIQRIIRLRRENDAQPFCINHSNKVTIKDEALSSSVRCCCNCVTIAYIGMRLAAVSVVLHRPYNSYHSWSFCPGVEYSHSAPYQYRPATPREIERDLRAQARTLRNNLVLLGPPTEFRDMCTSGSPRVTMSEIMGRTHRPYGYI